MTRTKRSKSKPSTVDPPHETGAKELPIRWYNPQPDDADVEWLDGNPIDSMADTFDMFEALSTEQRLSCKLDVKSGRWMAILFGVGVPEHNYTPAMSVRCATAADALLLLGYFVVRKYPQWYDAAESEHTSRFR